MTGIRMLAVVALLTLYCLPAGADKVVAYTIDPSHTQVLFRWEHAGFSHPGAVFRTVTGTILGNQDHPEKSSVDVVIPVDSLDAFVPVLTTRLLTLPEYFKAKEFPLITFKSTGMSDVDRSRKTFRLPGTLTINGVSRPVVLDVKANTIGSHPFYEGAQAAGFDATTTILRSQFHIGPNVPIVSDEIRVGITVEAVESRIYDQKQAELQQPSR
jgi:polyisoprenoid-binding protein YceI